MPTGIASLAGRGMLTAAVIASAALTGVAIGPGASPGLAAPAPDPVTFTAGVGPYSGSVPDGSCFVDVRVTGGAGGHNMVGAGSAAQRQRCSRCDLRPLLRRSRARASAVSSAAGAPSTARPAPTVAATAACSPAPTSPPGRRRWRLDLAAARRRRRGRRRRRWRLRRRSPARRGCRRRRGAPDRSGSASRRARRDRRADDPDSHGRRRRWRWPRQPRRGRRQQRHPWLQRIPGRRPPAVTHWSRRRPGRGL